MKPFCKRLVGALLLVSSSAVPAGPPYETDDPEPTDFHHWEIYNFVDLDGRSSNVAGEAGFDLNYGAAKDLQLTATLPLAFSHSAENGWRTGQGDVELGAKYRFVHDAKAGLEAAIFPRIILPSAAAGLGGMRTRFLLPIWIQKDIGKTSMFGGGGYEINPGSGNRDFWQAGLALTHDFSDRLQLGTEINWQSADAINGHPTIGADIGMIRKLGGPYSLLVAGGPASSAGKTGYQGYAALGLNF